MIKYIKSILIGCITIIFFYITQFIGSCIYLICHKENPLNYLNFIHLSQNINISPNKTALLIFSGDIFIIIIMCFILFYFKNLRIHQEFKLKLFPIKKLLVILPLGIGIAIFFSIFANLILRMMSIPMSYNVKIQTQMNSIYAYLVIILIGPIAEELVFRGFLFNYLDKKVNRVYAIILSSIVFAISHGDYRQGLYVIFLGIGLALIYIYTDSILGNILLHIIANSTGYILLLFKSVITTFFGENISSNIIGIVYIFYGLIFLLLGIYAFKKLENKNKRFKYLLGAILLIIGSIICFCTTLS